MTLSTHFCCFPEYAFKMYEKCKEDFRWKSPWISTYLRTTTAKHYPKLNRLKGFQTSTSKSNRLIAGISSKPQRLQRETPEKQNFSLKSITCGDSPGRLALINFSSSLYNALYAINTCCNFNNILSDNNREMASRTEIQL